VTAGDGCRGQIRMCVLWSRSAWSAVAVILALASSQTSHAASISAVDSKDGKTRLDLVGDITPGDVTRLSSQFKKPTAQIVSS